MPTVLVSNDDLTVLGTPEVAEVLVDIGPQGDRGSQIFVGLGNPNDIEIGQTPELNDLYINAAPGADYSYLYQYVSEPGGNTWTEVLKVNPTIYSKLHTVTFTAGTGTITIPIANITSISGASLNPEDFNIQYQITGNNPIASAMSVPTITGGDTNLEIDISAMEYDGGWQNIDGEDRTVHVFVSIML